VEEVPPNRTQEIERYLRLFGYKPERTILQVHVSGSFGRGAPSRAQIARRETAAQRYKGRTFTLVGRTHDGSLLENLEPPGKGGARNPGYMGYLFAGKDKEGKAPHERLPLDFVPNGVVYPSDWRSIFDTPSYLVTMHVPASFASRKNELLRRLRRIGGAVDVKKEWTFLDELEEYGYEDTPKIERSRQSPRRSPRPESDDIDLLTRKAKKARTPKEENAMIDELAKYGHDSVYALEEIVDQTIFDEVRTHGLHAIRDIKSEDAQF
jgi:hypothetical protein